jgi:predicted nucleic acid-binding Zn ribbon protein
MTERYENEQDFTHELRLAGAMSNAGASAAAINRTHRVVRERAKTMQEQKRRVRSLWIPLIVSFGFLASILFAVWSVLDESELLTNGIPDSSQNMMMLALWCIPLSVIVLVVVGFRRASANSSEGSRQ